MDSDLSLSRERVAKTLSTNPFRTESNYIRESAMIFNQGRTARPGNGIAVTLLARDYKGPGNQGINGAIEHEL